MNCVRLIAPLCLPLVALWVLNGCGSSSTTKLIPGCPPLSSTDSSSNNLASIVDPLIAQEMKSQGLVGASVAIAKNASILYSQGYGYADLATCTPVQPGTQFQIGSITKQFTAAAILQLQNAGKLNIDDGLSVYLPSYGFDSRITLRTLLNQTAGLQDYLNFPDANSWIGGVAESTVLAEIAQAPLTFTPGQYYAYSNSNYFVLGSVIEAVSSQTYADYLSSNIFQPLGLSNTSYLEPSGAASPYLQSQVAGLVPDPSLFFSAGALWSNVQDLATWDAALLGGKVIPSSLFTTMVTPSGAPNYPQGGATDYAMGWVQDVELGHPFIWHNGETFSYTSINGLFLDDGFTVVVLTNVPVSEGTPFLSLEEQIMQTVCSTSTTAGDC